MIEKTYFVMLDAGKHPNRNNNKDTFFPLAGDASGLYLFETYEEAVSAGEKYLPEFKGYEIFELGGGIPPQRGRIKTWINSSQSPA